MTAPGISLNFWTAYPSLLSTLGLEHRDALEEAACAHYCGRYVHATAIFDNRLPASHTVPILALQRADMLASQGLEHERLRLLHKTLQTLAFEESSPLKKLLGLMVADAELWVSGKLRAALEVAGQVRLWLQHLNSPTLSLSDIEVRCVILYYQITKEGRRQSNFMIQDRNTALSILPRFDNNQYMEAGVFRHTLQQRQHLRLSSVMMQMELAAAGDDQVGTAGRQAYSLCQQLEATGIPCLSFRSALLKNYLASLVSGDLSENFAASATALLRDLMPATFGSWEAFCPQVARTRALKTIKTSSRSDKEKAELLERQAEDALRRHDYTAANQAFIAARDAAEQWLDKVKGSESTFTALYTVQQVQQAHIELHRNTTGVAFFEGTAMIGYLGHSKNARMFLRELGKMERVHPDFGIPTIQHSLFSDAVKAARSLGLSEAAKEYEVKKGYWYAHLPTTNAEGLVDCALHPTYYIMELSHGANDMVDRGNNAVKLILKWARHELESGLLSRQGWMDLFGFAVHEDLPDDEEELDEFLSEVDFEDVAVALFGTSAQPALYSDWLSCIQRLEDWLIQPGRPPTMDARCYALEMIRQSRLSRLRAYLIAHGELPALDSVDQLWAEEEAITDLKSRNTITAIAENSSNGDLIQLSSTVRKTLAMSFVPGAAQSGLVSDYLLESIQRDSIHLIRSYERSRYPQWAFHHTVQMARIMWQRHVLFHTVNLRLCLEVLEEAETLFEDTRRDVAILGPSASLLARNEATSTFFEVEHRKLALYISYTIYLDSKGSPETRDEFFKWCARSKARGLSDLLGLGSGIPAGLMERFRSEDPAALADLEEESRLVNSKDSAPLDKIDRIQQDLDQLRESMRAKPLLKPLMDLKDGKTISRYQLRSMLNEIGGDVVVVDFIHMQYPTDSLLAAMYRRSGHDTIESLPAWRPGMLRHWVASHLDDKQRPLVQGDQALRELSKLMRPLFNKTCKFPIMPNETIMFCPTMELHRIPIHAIPTDTGPLIKKNPVIYCQSLTVLHRQWESVQSRDLGMSSRKRVVVNPLHDTETDETGAERPVESTERVANLAKRLDAQFHHGDLRKSEALEAMKGSAIYHHHGHGVFDDSAPLDAGLLLNRAAIEAEKSPDRTRSVKDPGCEVLTARDIFTSTLRTPTLATIIGCRSGVASISTTDDLLGLPTALLYAGASAVLSTLWHIDDDDGAELATYFYDAIGLQTSGKDSGTGFVHLAQALQESVLRLMSDKKKDRTAPYHWAAFYLSGFWLFPLQILR